MINDQGGVNGRKVNFISRDDGYSPPKTVEVVRKLVEQDQVLLLFNTLGAAPNLAIRDRLLRSGRHEDLDGVVAVAVGLLIERSFSSLISFFFAEL